MYDESPVAPRHPSWLEGTVEEVLRSFAGTERSRTEELQRSIEQIVAVRDYLRRHLSSGSAVRPISLGMNCSTAWYLKAVGLKQDSMPFDWIFSSTEIVAHAVQDGFELFLDRSRIFPLPKEAGAGHSFYHARMFNHRSPIATQEDFAYYQRCVERFKQVIVSGEELTFVCTLLVEPDRRPHWAKGFVYEFPCPTRTEIDEDLVRLLRKMNARSKFLFVRQRTNGDAGASVFFSDEGLVGVEFGATGSNNGVAFTNATDDARMRILLCGLSGVTHA